MMRAVSILSPNTSFPLISPNCFDVGGNTLWGNKDAFAVVLMGRFASKPVTELKFWLRLEDKDPSNVISGHVNLLEFVIFWAATKV